MLLHCTVPNPLTCKFPPAPLNIVFEVGVIRLIKLFYLFLCIWMHDHRYQSQMNQNHIYICYLGGCFRLKTQRK